MINLMELKPHEVSSDLKGYVIGVYGPSGCGKTTLASKADNALLIACEKGYKTIPSVMAVDVNTWTDVLTISSQLKKEEVKNRYEIIVIDTLDELVFIAEQHILNKHGVAKLNDLPYGAGHVELASMFRKLFRDIVKDYGLIILAQAAIKQDPEDEENYYATLDVNRKVKKIVMALLDMLVFVEAGRDPEQPNIAHFKASQKWEAKERFPNIVNKTVFSYENLTQSIQDAISGEATRVEHKNYYAEEKVEISEEEFIKLKTEVEQLGKKVIENDNSKMNDVVQLIDQVIGKKVKETTLKDAQGLTVLKEELNRM